MLFFTATYIFFLVIAIDTFSLATAAKHGESPNKDSVSDSCRSAYESMLTVHSGKLQKAIERMRCHFLGENLGSSCLEKNDPMKLFVGADMEVYADTTYDAATEMVEYDRVKEKMMQHCVQANGVLCRVNYTFKGKNDEKEDVEAFFKNLFLCKPRPKSDDCNDKDVALLALEQVSYQENGHFDLKATSKLTCQSEDEAANALAAYEAGEPFQDQDEENFSLNENVDFLEDGEDGQEGKEDMETTTLNEEATFDADELQKIDEVMDENSVAAQAQDESLQDPVVAEKADSDAATLITEEDGDTNEQSAGPQNTEVEEEVPETTTGEEQTDTLDEYGDEPESAVDSDGSDTIPPEDSDEQDDPEELIQVKVPDMDSLEESSNTFTPEDMEIEEPNNETDMTEDEDIPDENEDMQLDYSEEETEEETGSENDSEARLRGTSDGTILAALDSSSGTQFLLSNRLKFRLVGASLMLTAIL